MKFQNLPKWQLILIPVVLVILGNYYFARYFVADELIYANYTVEALQKDLRDALDLLEEEKNRVTMAERDADIARRANALLRDSERERQDEIAGLQADLAFYRRLGGANGSQAPLAVHYLELQATRSPRVFRIIFTLTQNLRWASVISGRVQLGIDGILDGAAAHLNQDRLLAETEEPMNFQFKYFQQLERLITLPEDFEPNRLTIRLRSGSLRTPVEQSMEWQSLFNTQSAGTASDEPPKSAGGD
jgi:hypothetical protein